MAENEKSSHIESLFIISHREGNSYSLSSLLDCLPVKPAVPTLILTEQDLPASMDDRNIHILTPGNKMDFSVQTTILSHGNSVLSLSGGKVHSSDNLNPKKSALDHLLGNVSLNSTRKIALYFLSEEHENPEALYALADKETLIMHFLLEQEAQWASEMEACSCYWGITPEKALKMVNRFLDEEMDSSKSGLQNQAEPFMENIFQLVYQHTHQDFSQYKRNTLYRRIDRRISSLKLSSVEEYLEILKNDPREIEKLHREFLIGVTHFFRDTSAFEYIRKKTLPQLLKDKDLKHLRLWVPACSSGEEVYTWAMLLKEYRDSHRPDLSLQIFGSDIDQKALEKAREGLYPAAIEKDVPDSFLKTCFIREGDSYRVKKEIREMIVFAEQNLLQDPPYSRVNIISCRNLLIYLSKGLQEQVLTLFHYALSPKGLLCLGNSETLGPMSYLFKEESRKVKIFHKIENQNVNGAVWNLNNSYDKRNKQAQELKPAAQLRDLAEKKLLMEYTPPAVLISQNGDILYIQGTAGRYLEFPTGELSRNIIRTAREGIKIALANAIRKARLNNEVTQHKNLRIKLENGEEYLNLEVSPVEEDRDSGLLMVIFKPGFSHEEEEEFSEHHKNTNATILELEKELSATQEYLQSTIEELETTNEELKSSNEEAQSNNEELQSANEELETSREELQSVNEELQESNQTLQQKIDELSKTNNDINNLLASTQIATLFLDKQMRIFRFTPSTSRIMDLMDSDIGRPVSQFSNKLDYMNMVKDARQVLENLVPKELDVQSHDGRSFWMRMIPYRTQSDSIEGVVVTFTDITEKRKQEEELKLYREHLEELVEEKTGRLADSEQKYRSLYEYAPLAYQALDTEGKITDVNPAWVKHLGYTHKEVLGKWFGDFLESSSRERFKQDFSSFLLRGYLKESLFRIRKKNGSLILISVDGNVSYGEDRKPRQVFCTFTDITESKAYEQELIIKNKALEESLNGFDIVDQNGAFVYANRAYAQMWGYNNPTEVLKSSPADHCQDPDIPQKIIRKLQKDGKADLIFKAKRKDGSLFDVRMMAVLYEDRQGKEMYMGTSLDITEQEEARKRLKESEEKYRLLVENQTDLIVKLDNSNHYIFVSQSFCRTFGVKEQEILGTSFYPEMEQEDEGNHTKALEDLSHPPYTSYQEERLKTSHGWRWFSWLYKADLQEDGSIREILKIGRDITDRKQAELALQESEKRHRMISSLSSDYSYSVKVDKKGKLSGEWHFGAFEKLTGYDPEEIWEGNTLAKLMHPDDREKLEERGILLQQGKTASVESRIICKNGDIRWIRDTGMPEWNDEENRVVRILGAAKDITEQKQFEEELKQRNMELSRAMQELKEAQEKLLHQERLAAMGQFSAGIAHDFNNILTGVLGTAEILSLDPKLSKAQQDHVQTILQSGERAAQLVRQIMDYSRKSIRKVKNLNMRQTLQDTLKIIRSGITEQYRIKLDCSKFNGNFIKADQTQIEQLIVNLVMNARDAIEGSGEIKISLKNRHFKKPGKCRICNEPILGDFIEIQVKDNGQGMNEETLQSIFEPFFTTKGIGRGSGLGLSQVYGIVVQYQGHIQLDSLPGKGTTISILLPESPACDSP